MALTYRALALMLSYPTAEIQAAAPEAIDAIRSEGLVPDPIVRSLEKLAGMLEHDDLYDLQEGFVQLFDRTRSLSLNLYEHIHGESRDLLRAGVVGQGVAGPPAGLPRLPVDPAGR